MSHDSLVVRLHKTPEETDRLAASHRVSLKPKAPARETAGMPEAAHARDLSEYPARLPAASAPQKRVRTGAPRFVFVIGIALLAAVAAGMFLSRSSATDTGATESVDALVAHVGSLILLPQGEEPTVATVSDLQALKGQAFFEHASLGDKVLMYPKAQEAVLYDPREDKVIQVAPLTVTPTK